MAINDASDIKKKNTEAQKLFRKYLKLRYLVIAVIVIMILSMYKGFFKAAFLMAIFTPLVIYSMKISKFVPHVNIELLSASAILISYIFGPPTAFFFSIVAGFYGIFKANYVTYLFIVRIIVTALVASAMGLFTNLSFNLNFIIGILAMNIILYFVYLVIDPDPMQNITHRTSHLVWNLLVVRFIYMAIYGLVKAI